MYELLHKIRLEIVKEISNLLDNKCSPCGGTHQDRKESRNRPSCKDCPILHELQEKGKLLEELRKNSTFAKTDINNLSSFDFYYLNTIKGYTVSEIANEFNVTTYRLRHLIDR